MIVTPIPALPTPPDPRDLNTFDVRAITWMCFLPTWNAALNTYAQQVITIDSGIEAAVATAQTAADLAVAQGDAGAYAAGTTYLYPTAVIGSDGRAYRCTKTGTGITGDNPVTSTSGYWTRIEPLDYINLFVDSLDGNNLNSGLSKTTALATVDHALSRIAGSGINAAIYLLSDRQDYTLSSRRTLFHTGLRFLSATPPVGRTAGVPKVTQEATMDGSTIMPGLTLEGAQVRFQGVDFATAASIPGGASANNTAPFVSGLPGFAQAVSFYGATLTLAATDFCRSNGGFLSLTLGGTLARPSGSAKLAAISSYGTMSFSAVAVTKPAVWSDLISGAVQSASQTNLLTNVVLSA